MMDGIKLTGSRCICAYQIYLEILRNAALKQDTDPSSFFSNHLHIGTHRSLLHYIGADDLFGSIALFYTRIS